MTEDVREVEWQFDAIDFRPVERWLDQPERWSDPSAAEVVADGNGVTQVDVYVETDDWRFQKAGYALRIRSLGRRRGAEATLKALNPASVGASGSRGRLEVSERLEGADMQTLQRADGPVGRRVRALRGTKRLLPLLEVRTRRRTFVLTAAGSPSGMVAFDETTIRPHGGGSPVRLQRVEIEVPTAATQAFEAFVLELRDACALQPAGLSKFEVGLLSHDLGPPAAPRFGVSEIDPEMTIGAVALAVLRRHFSTLLAKEPGTRLGDDIEALHDMRVANRRLRAAMALFADVLPEVALKTSEELVWVGQILGAVRDLDVQIEQLDNMLDTSEGTEHRALVILRSLLQEQREIARAAMLEMLDSRRYQTFVGRLGRTLRARHAHRSGPASLPARALAPDLIESRYRAVRKAGDQIGPDSPATEYHRLRIRCKRLRYALEFLGGLYPDETRPLIKRTVVVQDVLGLHQDACIAIDRLRHLSDSGSDGLDPATIFAMGEIAERYRASAIELRARFPAAYRQLTGKPWQVFREQLECARPTPSPSRTQTALR